MLTTVPRVHAQTIVVCAVDTILLADGHGDPRLFRSLDTAALGVFTLEIVIKVLAQGKNPHLYFKGQGWNQFDFFVVLMAYISIMVPLGPIQNMRLMRLLRVLHFLTQFPALPAVAGSLVLACSNVTYVLFLVCLIDFIAAAVAMMLFRKNDPLHFGTLDSTLVSIWQIETLDNWDKMMVSDIVG